jgi:hypothetical protein
MGPKEEEEKEKEEKCTELYIAKYFQHFIYSLIGHYCRLSVNIRNSCAE